MTYRALVLRAKDDKDDKDDKNDSIMTPVKDASEDQWWDERYDGLGLTDIRVGLWGCGKKGLSEREKCLWLTQRRKGRKGILLMTYTCHLSSERRARAVAILRITLSVKSGCSTRTYRPMNCLSVTQNAINRVTTPSNQHV